MRKTYETTNYNPRPTTCSRQASIERNPPSKEGESDEASLMASVIPLPIVGVVDNNQDATSDEIMIIEDGEASFNQGEASANREQDTAPLKKESDW